MKKFTVTAVHRGSRLQSKHRWENVAAETPEAAIEDIKRKFRAPGGTIWDACEGVEKQWRFGQLFADPLAPKSELYKEVAFIANENGLQPGELLIVPQIQNEGPCEGVPIMYFADHVIAWV